MIHMIKAHKRSPDEKLNIFERLAKSGEYGFVLVGEKTPNVPLKELGGTTLEDYYKEQAQKYKPLFDFKMADLRNYCCLLTYKLKKYTEGDSSYIDKEDIKYAKKTVVALKTLVNQKIYTIEEVAGYVRAISTLSSTDSSTDFKPFSRGRRKKKLEDAKSTLDLYENTGAKTKH